MAGYFLPIVTAISYEIMVIRKPISDGRAVDSFLSEKYDTIKLLPISLTHEEQIHLALPPS